MELLKPAEQISHPNRILKIGAAALLYELALLTSATSVQAESVEPKKLPDHLNTIVIVVDDMNDFSCKDTEKYLPKTSHYFKDNGTCFENATSPTPLCGPARAQLLTGQLPQNNHVSRQVDTDLIDFDNTIQSNLTDAGIASFGSGKLLNVSDSDKKGSTDTDNGFLEDNFWSSYKYHDYPLTDEDGKDYYPKKDIHTTVRVGNDINDFIDSMDDDERFFAYAGFYAPHYQVAPISEGLRARFPDPTPKNAHKPVPKFIYDPEKNLEDKLVYFQNPDHGRKFLADFEAARIRALYDVDDQMDLIFENLEERDELDTTAIFFVGDNGLDLGQNGWQGKGVPYYPAIKVPMYAFLPESFGGGIVDRRNVNLTDIAPTIYDLYGINPNHLIDGHSLLSDHDRKGGEFYTYSHDKKRYKLEESGNNLANIPSWKMVTHGRRSYIEYYEGGSVVHDEFYRRYNQTQNLLAPEFADQKPSKKTLRKYRNLLEIMNTCAGTEEAGSPNPCP